MNNLKCKNHLRKNKINKLKNKIFEINNVNVTPTKVTYEVQINKNVNDIEFRCYNNSNDDILINSLNATYESDK